MTTFELQALKTERAADLDKIAELRRQGEEQQKLIEQLNHQLVDELQRGRRVDREGEKARARRLFLATFSGLADGERRGLGRAGGRHRKGRGEGASFRLRSRSVRQAHGSQASTKKRGRRARR